MVIAHNRSRIHTAHAIEPLDYKPRSGPLAGTSYKKQAKEAAIQLGYPSSVLERIDNAETEGEINRIMKTARKEKFDEDL